jgi:hypothetical protein
MDRINKLDSLLNNSPQQAPTAVGGQAAPTAAPTDRFSTLENNLNSIEDSVVSQTGGKLPLSDRLALSFIREPENRKMFLNSRGITPEQFDEEDSNEGVGGVSPRDLVDFTDTILSTVAQTAGQVGGGIVGGAAGLLGGPTAPVTAPSGAFAGAMAGGAAAGATYDTLRNELVKTMTESGISDSDLAIEVIGGAAGPVIGKAFGSAVKLAKTTPGVKILAEGIERLSVGAKNKLAGALSVITGSDDVATKAFVQNPVKSLKLAGEVAADKSKLIGMVDDIITETKGINRAVNTAYSKDFKALKEPLSQVKFRNTTEVVEDIGTAYLDATGNKIGSPSIKIKAGPLAQEAADFLQIADADDLLKISNREALKTMSADQARSIPPAVLDVVKKPDLDFRDVELLRKTRNSLVEQVTAGKSDASAPLAFVTRLMEKVSDLPTAGPSEAVAAFKQLNKKYSEAYNLLDPVISNLSQGAGLLPKAGKVLKQATTSEDLLTRGAITDLRNKLVQLQTSYAPTSKVIEKLDTTAGVMQAQRLFKKGTAAKASQMALTGSFVGSQAAGKPGALAGGALGLGAGLAGQAPGLGVLGGAATGIASPVGSVLGRKALDSQGLGALRDEE